ncbi:hypothetical protein VdG1_01765 [Verticillium dahliae VDG1]|nr:hypothetical protein VdG1_01765 [Verticillium dahliae VDG1]
MAPSTDPAAAAAKVNEAVQTNLPAAVADKVPHIPETKAEAKEDAKKAVSAGAAQLRSLAAGGFGGICAVIVGHPFDLVKSIARDGLGRGLYAGVSAPLVGVTPMFAVSFWAYDLGKDIVRSIYPEHPASQPLTIGQTAAAGFFSAIPMTAITAPFERIKVILQVQSQKLQPGQAPRYKGPYDVVRQLYAEGGLRSVFRGSAATLARDGPGSAAYFAAYEYIKRPVPANAATFLGVELAHQAMNKAFGG